MKLLALEWNDFEARAMVVSSRGGQPNVEHAFVVSLQPSGSAEAGPAEAGRRIAAALAARGLGRLETLVAAGRSQIELRQLAVPPCPAEELPDVVRFQAIKEFNALKDDWPVDFVPLDTSDPPQSVLAATADPAWIAEIHKVLEPAGLKPRRLVLRPCATASLWRRRALAAGGEVQLLVDPLGTEVELTVLADRREFFLRTARLPADPAADAEARAVLVAEIRRTMVAAQNQLGGRRVESIVLLGAGAALQTAAASLGEDLGAPVERFDPLSGARLVDEAFRAPPEHPGRFAALLGMATDELERTRPAIDFLHPRRRQEPQGRRNALAVALLAGAIMVLLAVGYGFWSRQATDRRIRELSETSRRLEPQVADAEKIERSAREVAAWVEDDLVWMDELRWFCEKFPPAEEAMLTQLQIRPTSTGGELELQGFARGVETIKAMEHRLRDKRHNVVGRDKEDDRTQSPYTLRFRSSVFIQREGR